MNKNLQEKFPCSKEIKILIFKAIVEITKHSVQKARTYGLWFSPSQAVSAANLLTYGQETEWHKWTPAYE